ncbi:MAG: 3-deoxy-D-manno-octulosonic acid transferase, partial [Nitrospirae bacterium]
YEILSLIGLLLYLPVLFTKKGPEDRITFIRERLGLSKYDKVDIWLHAVSVGEMIAALPLLKAIKQAYPEKRIMLSTITYTGQKVAKEKCSEAHRIMYMPWDSSLILRRVIKEASPLVFITIETELWPNLFRNLKKHNTKILLMNGRISASSHRGYSYIKPFIKHVLSLVDVFCMQDEISAKRILSLGAPRERVKVIGNFKFHLSAPSSLPKWTEKIKGIIISAGSTHRGEDEIILKAYKDIKVEEEHVKLIIAPRHPERFKEVEELIKTYNMSYIKRTEIRDTKESIDEDVVLLDTIGELSGVYACCTIAFVGGSLVPIGGHNILEPAYWSKPIIIGPYMDNFPIVEDFIKSGAAFTVKDEVEMANTIKKLLRDKKALEEAGAKAKEIVNKNIGAVERAMEVLRGVL